MDRPGGFRLESTLREGSMYPSLQQLIYPHSTVEQPGKNRSSEPAEEEALNIQGDHEDHQSQDDGQPHVHGNVEESFGNGAAEDFFQDEEHHMSSIQDGNREKVDHRQVDRDHADEQEELPEIFAGHTVGDISYGEGAAHSLRADSP